MSAATAPAEATVGEAPPPREGRVPARRLAGHRRQGARRPPAERPVHRPADRARPGGGHPALLRGRPDPRGGAAGERRRRRSSSRCSRIGSQDYNFLRVDSFVAIVAPLLGLAFAFDAINGERSEGTLPRLLAQPIYRDDVINGKFAAGLAVIGVVLLAVIGIIAGFGIFRLGIVPESEEVVRLVAWIAVTFVYVGLWLAFGLLLSVLVRRAATSALVGFGVWFVLTIFGGLILDIIARTALAAHRHDHRGTDRPGTDPAIHQPAAARPAVCRDDRGPARPAQQPAARPAGVARPGAAGRAADPDAPRLRPEPPAGDGPRSSRWWR